MSAVSPYDTAASATTRFGIEVVAWIAGPWAIAKLTDVGWAAIPALIVLIAIPAVFSTTGDKKQVIVPTSGRLRVLIEMALLVIALGATWLVWPWWAALVTVALGAAMIATGLPRLTWLWTGAQSTSS